MEYLIIVRLCIVDWSNNVHMQPYQKFWSSSLSSCTQSGIISLILLHSSPFFFFFLKKYLFIYYK